MDIYYVPVSLKRNKIIDNILADILKRKFLRKKNRVNLSRQHLAYIDGLIDAGIDEADLIRKAIEKYDVIAIFTE